MRTPNLIIRVVEQLMARLGTPKAGREFIAEALADRPARKLPFCKTNVVMSYVIPPGQRLEEDEDEVSLTQLRTYDRDQRLRWLVCQPAKVAMPTRQRRLRGSAAVHQRRGCYRASVRFTPDFLVVSDAFYVDDWKSESQLERLRRMYPGRYVRGRNGWRCPERQQFFHRMGLVYRLRTFGTRSSRNQEKPDNAARLAC